jgi:hypothetical protein
MESAENLSVGMLLNLSDNYGSQIVNVVQVINENFIIVRTQSGNYLNIDSKDKFLQLSGISLTEEILEQNGFIRHTGDVWVQFRENSNDIYLRKDDLGNFYMINDDSEILL